VPQTDNSCRKVPLQVNFLDDFLLWCLYTYLISPWRKQRGKVDGKERKREESMRSTSKYKRKRTGRSESAELRKQEKGERGNRTEGERG
jgi:hypothetical protein